MLSGNSHSPVEIAVFISQKRLLIGISIFLIAILGTSFSISIPDSKMKSSFSTATVGAGTRIHVDSAAMGAMNGSSWTDAFTSLSVALDSARSCGIDTVLVAQGTYIPSDSLGVIPLEVRRASFTLSEDMVLLGGFSPAEGILDIDQRDWILYPTILSGDLMQDDSISYSNIEDLDDRPERDTNAFHIISQIEVNTSDQAFIDGFHFVGGNANADGLGDEPEMGGAIYLDSSILYISNCKFQFNAADYAGGAIYTDTSSYLNLKNVKFEFNYADEYGGAIFSEGKLIIDDSNFSHNLCDYDGGAILSSDTSMVRNSRFYHNEAYDGYGGGIATLDFDYFFEGDVFLLIDSCEFVQNHAFGGGAISMLGNELIVENSRIDSNHVYEVGGGILVFGNHAKVFNCNFSSNGAFAGGAIHGGFPEFFFGDIKEKSPTKMMPDFPDFILEIENSVFEKDSAEFGGGVSTFLYDTRISNSIFRGNYAFEYGGGVEILDGVYRGVNNLFSGNHAETGGGAITTELFLFEEQQPEVRLKTQKSTRKSSRRKFKKEKSNLKSMPFDLESIGSTYITNSTFASNSTLGEGGALNFLDTEDTLTNIIVWDNQDNTGLNTSSAGLYIEIIDPAGTGEAAITNSLMQGTNGSGGLWDLPNSVDAGGNIDETAMFVNTVDPGLAPHLEGEYMLRCNSPAIDAGTMDTSGLSIGTTDLSNNPRIQYSIIDMGAYEFRFSEMRPYIYVDSSAISGNNTGLTWEDAYLELSDALDGGCLEFGDTILVAKGTYFPDTTGLSSDYREAHFEMRDSLVILGGFSPEDGVDSIHERDWDLYESIVSGDIGTRNDTSDNVYNIFFHNGLPISEAALLDGLVFEGGNANGISSGNPYGGAMYNRNASPRIYNSTFRNNYASYGGGAIFNSENTAEYKNVKYFNNVSPTGAGAVYNIKCDMLMSDAIFKNNMGRSGGAISNQSSVRFKIVNSIFDSNIGTLNGGAISTYSSKGDTIIQCLFTYNKSRTEGSAVLSYNSKVTSTNSTFYENWSTDTQIGATGGAFRMFNGVGSLTNNIFWNNQNSNGRIGPKLQISIGGDLEYFDSLYIGHNIIEDLHDAGPEWPLFFGVDEGGNLDDYPEFVDTSFHDFRLQCSSPAIEAGREDTTGLCLLPVDLGDSMRFIGKRIDMGVYEKQGGCPTIELNSVDFGEVCDTTTSITYIKNIGVGDLEIDTIVSLSPLFTYNESVISFPIIIPYCDSVPIGISYNPVLKGSYNNTLEITSNAINASPGIISLSAVLDTTKPSVICMDTTVYLDANGLFTIDSSFVLNTAMDNCSIGTMELSQENFGCTHISVLNTVTLTVYDIFGNFNTCTASVNVLDTISPIAIHRNTTIYLDALGEAVITAAEINNGSSDACGIASIAIDSSNFNCTEVGINPVVLTVMDVNGNSSNSTSSVTVSDTISPIAICRDITIYLNASGMASITASNVENGSTDACGIASYIVQPVNFSCADIGTTIATLTVTDVNSNSGTCESTITVIDTVAPTPICQNISVPLNELGVASIAADLVNNGSSDACGIQSIDIDSSDFDCTEIGVNNIELTVIDARGNIATCYAEVTVTDPIAPDAKCKNISRRLSYAGRISIVPAEVNNNSSDACGISNYELSDSAFTCDDIGDNIVTLTVTDVNGNMSQCVSTITIHTNGGAYDASIVGPQRICDNLLNLPYSVTYLEGVSYNWTYSGNGVDIKNNGKNEVSLDVGMMTAGTLSVTLIATCGELIGTAELEILKGGEAFCNLASCLREYAFISNEVLAINESIDVYKVSERIKSEAEIMAPRSIIFKAGHVIEMDAPFSVGKGSIFAAEIETCENELTIYSESSKK